MIDCDVPERAYLVAFGQLHMLGPARLDAVLGGRIPSEAWGRLLAGDARAELASLGMAGVSSELVQRWQSEAAACDVEALWNKHSAAGVEIVVPGDEFWPTELFDDPEPPAMLFAKGPMVRTSHPAVAIVGTRRCSSYGRSVAAELGTGLAQRGVTVVSGVAAGIDSVAQRSALEAGGEVVGVVGSGVDVVYPASNRRLWNDIAQMGRLWSETPLGVKPARWRFPARNRIIAALADVVVVVESPAKGGSLYTVDSAIERDRVVMAVPGPINSMMSVGTNRLLIQGCEPVTGVEDILAALGLCASANGEPVSGTTMLREASNKSDQATLDAIGFEAKSIDAILASTGLDLVAALGVLGRLQAEGLVRETAGWWERA